MFGFYMDACRVFFFAFKIQVLNRINLFIASTVHFASSSWVLFSSKIENYFFRFSVVCHCFRPTFFWFLFWGENEAEIPKYLYIRLLFSAFHIYQVTACFHQFILLPHMLGDIPTCVLYITGKFSAKLILFFRLSNTI